MEEKLRVLVVEDDIPMLQGIAEILEMAGYEVLTAIDGLEGLNVLEQKHPDLIISDIMMPRMDGYDFYNTVRSDPRWMRIPFIFLTARGQKQDVRFGKQLGADDYIVKPFEPEDLLVAVEAKLSRAAALEAAFQAELAELKEQILSALSHEFRTPLTFIQGYLDLILDEGPERLRVEDLKRFLERIRRGSHRLTRLIESLLFLVSLESGEVAQVYQWEAVIYRDWAKLIRRAVSRVEAQAVSARVQIEVVVDPVLPPARIHPRYLQDAVERLLDNAIKFSKTEGGSVTIRVSAEGPWLQIVVQDQGIGIAPEALPHLFRRFQQIDRKKREQQGAGLGLAIVKRVVQIHGGRVTVESTVGVGSTFTISLPIVSEPPET